MPTRAPRICQCGKVVPSGTRCSCQEAAARERKARFDNTRPSAAERGYNAEWRKERKIFLSLFSKCARCAQPATLVDHRIPHRGDQRLFWDRKNWQSLCSHCHNSHKQAAERRS
ncbi:MULTISPECIES: HNH endonuclease [unclassified Rhizobium]|uniref:HNH endonuclease signature motif containing protein n=1 Tax=unclassified Rhizobium TaxID=2613769 RepID=UPI0025D13379|nr:HNH endonuclease [Rhizobium sp. UBA1881]